MTSDIPPELSDLASFQLFSGGKYIVILYDVQGRPLWAANRNFHTHAAMIECLMEEAVHHFYKLPPALPLTKIFESFALSNPQEADFTRPLREIPPGRLRLGGFPTFPSNNTAEARALSSHFAIQLPLTRLHLLRINSEKFLGVVSFPEIVSEIIRAESRMAILVDGHNAIAGLNSLFAQAAGKGNAADLLGKPVGDTLTFSRDPFQSPSEEGVEWETTGLSWRTGAETLPFEADPHCRISEGKEGLLLENESPTKYAFVRWKEKLPFDSHHLRVEIRYENPPAGFPNLIVRGLLPRTRIFPDLLGYSLSSQGIDRFDLKRHSDHVHRVVAPALLQTGTHTLLFKKIFNDFLTSIDGGKPAFWKETVPSLLASDDLFYMFLKPEEKLVLQSVEIRSAPILSKSAFPPLRAKINSGAGHLEYNVSFSQRTLANEAPFNYTLFFLDDITDLKENISHLEKERDRLSRIVQSEKTFVGKSPALTALRAQLPTLAQSELAVLIEGETGTGKEVLARSIHQASPRAGGPFLKIDCSAIPESLIESELFGHEKGAFTGAHSSRAGRFEQAEGGTVFLDEVANLPMTVQAKLLNVLQDRQVQRVGGGRPLPLDLRLIAASNIPLERLMAEGKFRQDLFFRLNQFKFELPPLRERREDIPLLADHFLAEAGRTYRKRVRMVSPAALRRLYEMEWPGNARELRNVIFRAALFCEGETLEEQHLMTPSGPVAGASGPRPGRRGGARKKNALGKETLENALRAAKGNVRKAAQAMEISRNLAYVLMRKFGLLLEDFRLKKPN